MTKFDAFLIGFLAGFGLCIGTLLIVGFFA